MMNYIELPFVKMSADAVTPTRATAESAGLDFYSPADYIIPPPDYMGEIMVLLINTASRVQNIPKGAPIAQLIPEKISIPILKEVNKLLPTTRGAQGCGF